MIGAFRRAKSESDKETAGLVEFAQDASIAGRGQQWEPFWYLKRIGRYIESAIQDESPRYIIVNMPVRHGKSELISHWTPTWFLNTWPWARVILSTYNDDFASEWGRKVRKEIEYNPRVDRAVLTKEKKAASVFELVQGGAMYSAGVGGSIAGRGGNLMVLDDPYKNWEEATSPTIRAMVENWWGTTFWTRREPWHTVVVCMNRWVKGGLPDYLQEETDVEWEVLRFPALADETMDNPLDDRQPGQPLNPDRYDADALDQMKAGMTPLQWSGIGQQQPRGEFTKQQLFEHAMFENNRAETAPGLDEVVVALDPPGDHKKESSECGIVVGGRVGNPQEGQAYVLEDASGHMTPKAWGDMAVLLFHKYNADRVIGETNYGGEMVETIVRGIDQGIPFRMVRATRGKALRAEPVAVRYARDQVSHVGTFDTLEDQCVDFRPGQDESPDRMDALVWLLTDLFDLAKMKKVVYG